MRTLLLFLSLSLVALISMTCSSPPPDPQPEQSEASDDQSGSGPRTGSQVFASTCAVCHGDGGEGAEDWMVRDEDGRLPAPPLNGDGHTWHHSDGVLYGIVSEGGAGIGFGSNMPGFKDELTREEIIAVLEYVKTLWEGKEIDGFPIAESQRELSESDPYPVSGG